MDQGRAEVRIMTAHAAKGLEAPVVFLVDNGARPFSEQHLPRLLPFDATGKFWQGKGYLWRAAADIANGNSRTAAARIKEAAEEEYRRLLYVGMTRAEDRLIVCGYYGKIQPTAGTWHALVSAALAGAPETEALPDPILEGTRHRYRVVKQPARPERPDIATPPLSPPKEAPAWLTQPVPAEPVLPRPLTPSRRFRLYRRRHRTGDNPEIAGARRRREAVIGDRQGPCGAPAAADPAWHGGGRTRCRGAPLYRARGRRVAAGRTRLGRALGHAAAWRRRVSRRSSRRNSRAEVGIAGTLEIGGIERSISGKIDRLAVTASDVLIVDYKTNRPAPSLLRRGAAGLRHAARALPGTAAAALSRAGQ